MYYEIHLVFIDIEQEVLFANEEPAYDKITDFTTIQKAKL